MNLIGEKKVPTWALTPLFQSLYLRPNERFNKAKKLDTRKYFYQFRDYKEAQKEGIDMGRVAVYPDEDLWALESENDYDLAYIMSKHYFDKWAFGNFPMVGVTGTQIKGFLEWKEWNIQKLLDEKGFDYRVRVSLPTEKESKDACDCDNERPSFNTIEKDMNEHWRITNADYKEFVDWVEDSLLRETGLHQCYKTG